LNGPPKQGSRRRDNGNPECAKGGGVASCKTLARSNPMATYRLLSAAAAFAVMTAPAMAQQAMGEPGYCAFYYPNANCQNKGPGNPYTGDAWLRLNQGSPMPGSHQPERPAKKRAHRS
jgi:hypothetical protein